MAREDISTSVDDETRGLVRGGYSPPKPKPVSDDKLSRQVDREAVARREGRGR